MNPGGKRDLIVLVADKNMAAAVSGMLQRHVALGIGAVMADILRHPEKDCGCRTGGVEFLSSFVNRYHHALLIFDHEGCGVEKRNVQELEEEIETSLREKWGDKGAVVIIAPELDIWVWSDSPHVERVLGWAERTPKLRSWLSAQGYIMAGQKKPIRPKEALEEVLRVVRKPRSSSIYQSLAKRVTLARCSDRAFVKLRTTLQQWFKEE
jgi:hypothetical protein